MSGTVVDMVQVYLYRRHGDGEVEYLLLRRAADEDLYPGLWQMVTGSREDGETALQAARRELREETGIDAAELHVVPYVAMFYLAHDDSIHQVPVFAAEAPAECAVTLSNEHDRCEWLPFREAWRRLVFPGHREGLRILRDYVLSG